MVICLISCRLNLAQFVVEFCNAMATIDPKAEFSLRISANNLRLTIDNTDGEEHEGGHVYLEIFDFEHYNSLAVWLNPDDAQSVVDTLTFWLEQQKLLGNLS